MKWVSQKQPVEIENNITSIEDQSLVVNEAVKLTSKYNQIGKTKIKHYLHFTAISSIITTIDEGCLTLCMVNIQKDLNISTVESQWIMSIYYLATAIGAIPLANLGKKFGTVNMLLALYITAAIFYFTAFFEHEYTVLLVLRFFQGLSTSGQISIRNMANTIYPNKNDVSNTLKAHTLVGSIVALTAPIFGMILVQFTDWYYIFLLSGTFSLITGIIVLPFENSQPQDAHFDVFGTITFGIATASFCMTFTMLSNFRIMATLLFLIIMIIFTIIFILIEKKQKYPILPLEIMKNPLIDVIWLHISNYMGQSPCGFIVPQILGYYGWTPLAMAIATGLLGIVAVIATITINGISKRVVSRYLLVVCFVGCTIFISVAAIVLTQSVPFILSMFAMMFMFMIAAHQITYPSLMQSVPSEYSNYVSGLPTMSRTVGSTTSLCIVSCIQFIVQQETDDKLEGYQYALWFIGILFFIDIFISLFRIGNQRYEAGKLGYKNECVREVKIQQRNTIEMRQSAEEKL